MTDLKDLIIINDDGTPKTLHQVEGMLTAYAMKYYKGNKGHASQALGIWRNTLRRILDRTGYEQIQEATTTGSLRLREGLPTKADRKDVKRNK